MWICGLAWNYITFYREINQFIDKCIKNETISVFSWSLVMTEILWPLDMWKIVAFFKSSLCYSLFIFLMQIKIKGTNILLRCARKAANISTIIVTFYRISPELICLLTHIVLNVILLWMHVSATLNLRNNFFIKYWMHTPLDVIHNV